MGIRWPGKGGQALLPDSRLQDHVHVILGAGAGPDGGLVPLQQDLAIGDPHPVQGGQDVLDHVDARAAALGQALAERVQKGDAGLVFADLAPISYLGTRVPLPPYQIRFRLGWRFSPLLLPLLGVDSTGWIQAVRIGDTVLIGLPVEPSSELGKTWKDSFTSKDLSLWFCSFSSDYRGYVSPDIYYRAVAPDGSLPYETGLMSWCGPDAAQYFGTITRWLVRLMAPEAVLPDIPESPGLPPAPNRPATPPDTP